MGSGTIHKRLPVAPRRGNSSSGFLLLIAFLRHSIELFTLENQQCHKESSYHFSFFSRDDTVGTCLPPDSLHTPDCSTTCTWLSLHDCWEGSGISPQTLESRLMLFLLHAEPTASAGHVHQCVSDVHVAPPNAR